MNMVDAVQALQVGRSAGGERSQQAADREGRGEIRVEDAFSASGWAELGARVQQTSGHMADRFALAPPRVMASFEESIQRLMDVDPELVEDYLMLVDILLEEEDKESSLDRFVRAVYGELQAGVTPEGLSGVFQGTMARLSSMARVTARVEAEVRVSLTAEGEAQEGDPLVLDLAGDGISLTGVEAGVLFDIDGDGRQERTSFVRGDDAFLALDRNGNGQIDSGKELFGDHHGAANGFAELARFDDNGDGRIDGGDAVYSRLKLFQDRNGSGISDPGELRGLAGAGVRAIELDFEQVNESMESGDRIVQLGRFVRGDGGVGTAADAMVRFLDVKA